MYRKEHYSKIASKPLRTQLAIGFVVLGVGFSCTLWAEVSSKESASVFESFVAHGGGILGFMSWFFAMMFPMAHLHQRFMRLTACSSRHSDLIHKPAKKIFYRMLIVFLVSLLVFASSRDLIFTESLPGEERPFRTFFTGVFLLVASFIMFSAMYGFGFYTLAFLSPETVRRRQSE